MNKNNIKARAPTSKTKIEINNIFAYFQSINPNPKTELNYKNNFTLLIAVVLSAQATDISVNKASKDLFIKVDNPKEMLKLGYNELTNHIKTIGLWRGKAKNIIAICQILIDKFNSQIPKNLCDLMSLPGVGRKTANVVLNEAFNLPTIGVDTHVFRVSNKTGIALGTNPDMVEQNLLSSISDPYKANAHHHLLLHGRYICKARNPLCNECKIQKYCDYYIKNGHKK